ncbi:hypothetical protein FRB99_002815, partial [Tulasnella sp. 403]
MKHQVAVGYTVLEKQAIVIADRIEENPMDVGAPYVNAGILGLGLKARKGILRGNKLVTKPFRALIDTGTLDVVVPYDIAEEFYAQVSGAYLTRDGVWIHPCAPRFADIALQFDDNQYAFHAKYLDGSRVRSKPSTCVGIIQGADVELAVIGGTFLKFYYTVYNYRAREIGFALV